MITVLIADDQEMLHDAFQMGSQEAPYQVVGSCFNGQEVLEQCATLKPDVIVLDIELPGRNGLDVATELKEQHPALKILIASRHKDPVYIRQAIQLKVNGFMHKDESPKRYYFILFTIMSGNYYLSPVITETVFDFVNDMAQIPSSGPHLLTTREYEITQLIAQGFTTKKIAEILFLSINTINNHRRSINKKLNVSHPGQLLEKIRQLSTPTN